MSRIPLTIARREVRETATDWRILFPLLVLSLLIPLLILAGVRILIDQRSEPATGAWMIPLALLLCGFLPAGFSLVHASESFVGEKERYTLEALISTPMRDRDLYLGKLIAAVIPPLGSSSVAMLNFTVTHVLTAPATAIYWFDFGLGLLIGALVCLKVLVLVAVTLIISMQATTVRAANLLASFTLVPMAMLVQIEALLMAWQQVRFLIPIMAGLILLALALIRSGLVMFDREAMLSRDHGGFNLRRTGATFRRFLAEYHPEGVGPERYRGAFSLRRFYRIELPALIRDYRVPLAFTSVALVAGLVLGAQSWTDRAALLDPHTAASSTMLTASSVKTAGVNFVFNVRVAFLANLLAIISLGLFAFIAPGYVAMKVGFAVMGQAALGSNSLIFVPYLLSHALFILPAMLFSGALGLQTGLALLRRRQEFTLGQHMLWSLANFLKVFTLVIVPTFALAALMEAILRMLVARWSG